MRTKQKILQLSKEKLGFISLAIFFNILLAGSVCGTFAWYSYATRTGFEKQYHGVTVGVGGKLDVGVTSDVELEGFEQFELTEDKITLSDENKIIYWCENKIRPEVLNFFASSKGYATNSLCPVTTGSNDILQSSDKFHLFKSPSFLKNYSTTEEFYADKSEYIHIPFVFRYSDPEISEGYIADEGIYFKECKIEVSEENQESKIDKAIRIYSSNGTVGHLINPTSETDSFDPVGGILDLNKDGFYDFNQGHEYIYGEAQHYNFNADITQSDGTLPDDEINSFVSNHKAGIYALDESTFKPKVVNYSCMRNFANKVVPISKTDANYHNLARLDFYVYIEGWDLNVIDREIGCVFNMNVLFSIYDE